MSAHFEYMQKIKSSVKISAVSEFPFREKKIENLLECLSVKIQTTFFS